MTAEHFINSIDTKVYSKIRSSMGDAECKRYLKEHLQKQLTIEIPVNDPYWFSFEIDKHKQPKDVRYSSRVVNGMDVIDLCKHWDLNFNEGNILKYLLRKKGEDISDMKKIVDYATREYTHIR
jgi:hypothetical protein